MNIYLLINGRGNYLRFKLYMLLNVYVHLNAPSPPFQPPTAFFNSIMWREDSDWNQRSVPCVWCLVAGRRHELSWNHILKYLHKVFRLWLSDSSCFCWPDRSLIWDLTFTGGPKTPLAVGWARATTLIFQFIYKPWVDSTSISHSDQPGVVELGSQTQRRSSRKMVSPQEIKSFGASSRF